ncbi:MAG TPA: hypothetical protein VIT44_03615 [Cyclobacteriaceae bacterium]
MNAPVNKPATWFWIVSVISLIWNLMGVMAFVMQVTMTEEALQAMSEAERSLYTSIPAWTIVCFAIAVFGDTLASILLLLRKKLATMVFIVSFFFTLSQMIYTIFISDLVAVRGIGATVFPVVIVIAGILLIWFSRVSAAKGWLK